MKNRLFLITFVLVVVLVGMIGKEAVGQDAKTFYKGANLRIIVPYAPGGSYDLMARVLSPPLEKHTGARLLVENMAGAGGSIGPNYLYNIAKPDGLTIGFLPVPSLVISDVLELEGVKYELDKFAYIGGVEADFRCAVASKASGYKTMVDMQKTTKTVRWATADIYAQASVEETLIAEGFGLNAKIVTGYKGSLESFLSVVAGRESDAGIFVAANYEDQMKRGEVTLIAMLGDKRSPRFPQIPTLLETPGVKPEGRKYIELVNVLGGGGRAFFAPPGMPEDKRLYLEQALAASLKDPGIVSWSEKQGLEIAYLPGKKIKQLVDKLTQIVPKAEKANLKHIVTKKYYYY